MKTRLFVRCIYDCTYLEEVKSSSGMETRLFVRCIYDCRFLTLVRVKGSVEVKLEAFREDIIELDLTAQDVGRGPSLGDRETMLDIVELGLDIARDQVGLGIPVTSDLESDVGGCFRLDFERRSLEGVVFSQKVV